MHCPYFFFFFSLAFDNANIPQVLDGLNTLDPPLIRARMRGYNPDFFSLPSLDYGGYSNGHFMDSCIGFYSIDLFMIYLII